MLHLEVKELLLPKRMKKRPLLPKLPLLANLLLVAKVPLVN
jgi:hypothetical protein